MAYTVTPLTTSLTLDQATSIIDAALAAAREHEISPLTVVVLDAGGHQIALKREDGCGIIRVEVAVAKAYGALGMGVSGRVFGQRLSSKPVFATGLSAVASGQFLAVPGGVLILDEAGAAIGAVGVSGDNSERDEFAAISGIAAAGFASEPSEPLPDWNA
jgi:uncharacterized protein GlcG (DUF336 family)